MSASSYPGLKYSKGQRQAEKFGEDRAARKRQEDKAKREAKERDGRICRVPFCGSRKDRVEGAHVADKGMGGNKDGSRNVRQNILTLCYSHHQGSRNSLHTGQLEVECVEPSLGTDGPVKFFIDGRYIGMTEPR